MTKVSFYVLNQPSEAATDDLSAAALGRLQFVCRLTEKAHRSGAEIFIAVNNEQEAHKLDQYLWQHRPESFIPHALDSSDTPACPVTIGFSDDCGEHHDLLINLRSEIPTHFSRFERLAEIVSQEEKVLTETREHFTFYRQRGYPIETHNIG